MPNYDFECNACGKINTWHAAITDDIPHNDCGWCGSTDLKRVWNVPAVKFNASGFYSTDNK